MIHHSAPDTSRARFKGQPKAATLKLKAATALSMRLSRTKRLLGTLHLPAFVWPR